MKRRDTSRGASPRWSERDTTPPPADRPPAPDVPPAPDMHPYPEEPAAPPVGAPGPTQNHAPDVWGRPGTLSRTTSASPSAAPRDRRSGIPAGRGSAPPRDRRNDVFDQEAPEYARENPVRARSRPADDHRTPQATAVLVPSRVGWVHEQPELLSVVVWTERVAGRGEDAEPLFTHHQESGQGVLAVFDGAGGAGASPVWPGPDGTMMTAAWTGSRVARLATECWFHEVGQGLDTAAPDRLHTYLEYFLSSAPQRRSKISGTMRRQSPTTLAAVHYATRADRTLELRALWAGDSRAYVLRPEQGLQVLTRDHTWESDALELLRTDPPMTNLACADRPFTVDSQYRKGFDLPCVLVTATDGVFGYVQTPADFERILLSTLRGARSAQDWAERLCQEVHHYTGDDASLVVTALGYRDFASLRDDFAGRFRRLDELADRFGPPPAPASGQTRAWQDRTWQEYRASYEAFLPADPEEGMS